MCVSRYLNCTIWWGRGCPDVSCLLSQIVFRRHWGPLILMPNAVKHRLEVQSTGPKARPRYRAYVGLDYKAAKRSQCIMHRSPGFVRCLKYSGRVLCRERGRDFVWCRSGFGLGFWKHFCIPSSGLKLIAFMRKHENKQAIFFHVVPLNILTTICIYAMRSSSLCWNAVMVQCV